MKDYHRKAKLIEMHITQEDMVVATDMVSYEPRQKRFVVREWSLQSYNIICYYHSGGGYGMGSGGYGMGGYGRGGG